MCQEPYKTITPCKPLSYSTLERILRVNQAGEYGAFRIYAGQIAILQCKPYSEVIKMMMNVEIIHLNTCNRLLKQYRVRPTMLQPLWHVLGFILGVGTALLGGTSAIACTISVEEVIEEHYTQQSHMLKTIDPELQTIILELRADEVEHCVLAYSLLRNFSPIFSDLLIKTSTKLAIWLSERI